MAVIVIWISSEINAMGSDSLLNSTFHPVDSFANIYVMDKFLLRFSSFLIMFVFVFLFPIESKAATPLPVYNYTHISTIYDDEDNIIVRDVATDSHGNVYIVGSFEGAVIFNPNGPDREQDGQSSLGGQDAFVTKLNANGTYGYTKVIASYDDEFFYQIAFDSSDNMFLAGTYFNTTDFDWSDTGTDELTPVGGHDMFLTKINADGTYGFTYNVGGAEYEYPNALIFDESGNMYLGGSFTGTTDFDPTADADELTSNGHNDAFLTKFNADYSYAFTYTWGGVNEDYLNNIVIDSNSNVYYSGYFRDNTVDFDPTHGTDEYNNAGYNSGYLAKIGADGSYLGSYVLNQELDNRIYGLAIDSLNRIYLTGEFYGSIDFDLGSNVDEHINIDAEDAFLVRLNSDLTYNYAYTFGSAGTDAGIGVVVDNSDNVYLRGITSSTNPIDFDPTAGEDIKTATYGSGFSMFVTRINKDKSYGFTAYFIGTEASDYSIGYGDKFPLIAFDNDDALYIAGRVTGSPINYNYFGSDVITLPSPSANYSALTKFTIIPDPEINSSSDDDADEDDDNDNDKKEVKKCDASSPSLTSWVKLKPTTYNGVRGMYVTWTQYGADKIRIAIDDGTGIFPWMTDKIINDGHEFLPNVASSQKIMIKPINKCKGGAFTPGISYQSNPFGWFN